MDHVNHINNVNNTRTFVEKSGALIRPTLTPETSTASAGDIPVATPVHNAGRMATIFRPVTASLRSALPAILAYALVRVVGVSFVALWSHQRGVPIMTELACWDSNWYTMIAEHGHDQSQPPQEGFHSNMAFFPLYPYLMKFVHNITFLDYQLSGLLISFICALVTAWGIFAIGDRLYGRRVGILAAVTWAVAPLAIVQNMVYAESLLTAFAAWALYAALTQRWIAAGVLSSIAGVSRANGIAVAAGVGLAALIELFMMYRARRAGDQQSLVGKVWWKPFLAGAIAPLGWLSYIAYVGVRFHRWDGYFRVQDDGWGSKHDFGVATLRILRSMLFKPGPDLFPLIAAAIMVGSVILFLVTITERQKPMLLMYSFTILFIGLGNVSYFWCQARYILPAFPLAFPIAQALASVRSRATLYLLIGIATIATTLCGAHVLMTWRLWP